MRNRLLLGPVLIVLLVAGLAVDQWIQGQPLPLWMRFGGQETWPPAALMLPIVIIISLLGARELAAILCRKGIESSKRIMSCAAILGLLVSCLVPSWTGAVNSVAVVSTAAMSVLAVSMVYYSRRKSVEGVVAAAGGALLSFVYLGLMFGFLLAIRREHSAWVMLWVIAVTKACDIGAYFTGRAIGKHKLIPWLSPGKTWEGLWGGLILACVVSAVGLWLLKAQAGVLTPPIWLGIGPGIMFGVVGQAGDLIESIFKRDAGAKDSGRSLPGFGGVLDVLDSPLLVAPVAFWWLRLLETQGFFTNG